MTVARRILRIGSMASACLLVVFTALSLGAAQPSLNLLIWSEYIDPQVVADFERLNGCRVVIDLFEDESAMVAKIRNGGASQYDVVVAPDHTVPKLSKLQLLRPLHLDRLAAITNLESRFLNPPYDRGNRYSIPYLWGTLCVYARVPKGKTLVPSWGLFFDPKQQPDSFLLIDGMRDLMGAALKYRGHSLNTTNILELKEARDLILNAKRRSMGFEGGAGGKNKVLAKTVAAAMAYSGDALRGVKEDSETVCFIPKEGSQIWVDNLVVCSGAPHAELAEKFLAFLLEPRVSARLANFLNYATPNRESKVFLEPSLLNNPAVYPPPDVMSKLEFVEDLGRSTRLYDEVWTQIRTKY